MEVKAGDVLLHVQPGSGGYGNPLHRDPSLVLSDIRAEKISPEYANRVYGVVLDEHGVVDFEATDALRRTLEEQRLGK